MESKPLVLVGVGKVGIGIVSRVKAAPRVFVDADASTLMGLEGTTVFIGAETGGAGTGKDPQKAYGMAQQQREPIHAALTGAEVVVVVGAAGGGTGAGACSVVAECANELGAAVAVFMIEPLAYEGQTRLAAAKTYLHLIEQHADALFLLPGKPRKEATPTEAKLSELLAGIENGLVDILGTLSEALHHGIEPADLRKLLEACGRAQIGYGAVHAERGIEAAFESACHRSFLDLESLNAARGLSLIVVAPAQLNMDDLLRVTQRLESHKPNLSIDTHVATPPAPDETYRVLVISRGIQAAAEAPPPDSLEKPTDDELVVDGVNLEVPTYIRRARLRVA